MKCPKCVEEGKRSTLYSEGGTVTCMAGPRYYDEDGKWHDHDPNWHSMGYSCSNGHSFQQNTVKKCPNCDYGGKEEITFHTPPKITSLE